MQPFLFERAANAKNASLLLVESDVETTKPIAGGTTLLDLMKLNVMRPEKLIDISHALPAQIVRVGEGVKLGAMVRMADAASNDIIAQDYPVIQQALMLAASAQIRNMASLGGNVLQRTRCGYFRDQTVPNCNKRLPGSGCSALDGINRMHAVLGTTDKCIATYPGDFAQALMALDAKVEIAGQTGQRTISFSDLHVPPNQDPAIETTLAQGDLITGFILPAAPWTRRSLYLKVRDRDSYAYALASAAIALDMDGDQIREARIAIGGVATIPWRARNAEDYLKGKVLNEAIAMAAGAIAFESAKTRHHNAYKPKLGAATIARALLQAKALEIKS
jgi:xanthine dehydrogenase YagS FAD-binding subunit